MERLAITGTFRGEKSLFVASHIDINMKRRVSATVERDPVFGTFSSTKHAERIITHIEKMQAGADEQDWTELTIVNLDEIA